MISPIERIEFLCVQRNITIYRLEKELGFARNTIKHWGAGTGPTCKAIILVAEYFNVSVDYLLGRTSNYLSHEEQISEGSMLMLKASEELHLTIDEAKIASTTLFNMVTGYRKLLGD